MKPLDIHINLTNEDYQALLAGNLHWVERQANAQRIQTVLLFAPEGRHRKPRRIGATAAASLAENPKALADAIQEGRLIPRGRRVIFHKGYSTVKTEATLTGLGLLIHELAVFHLAVTKDVIASAESTDARGVEVMSEDTLVDPNGNTIGKVTVNSSGSAFVIAQQAIPLEVFDSKKYIVKL
jgi:hypothetical protein